LLLSVALSDDAPRAAPWTFETHSALAALAKAHAALERPSEAGAGVALKRK